MEDAPSARLSEETFENAKIFTYLTFNTRAFMLYLLYYYTDLNFYCNYDTNSFNASFKCYFFNI